MPKDSELSAEIERLIREHSEEIVSELRSRIEERLREEMKVALGAALGEGTVAAPSAPKRRALRAPAATAAPAASGETCGVMGCNRPKRSLGYCGAHYQSARKYGWPRPCPEGFDPPVRKRGRPSKAAEDAEESESSNGVTALASVGD
jgi:hypothetical protein